MWLTPGSFWTQPAGESHVTAANAHDNLIYLEIDSGPYLVLSSEKAFDNGERPVNVDARNLVWLDAKDIQWLKKNQLQMAFLWGDTDAENGSFVKLPAGFSGAVQSDNELRAVVVSGVGLHQYQETTTTLSPSSFFSSNGKVLHHIRAETELVLYINAAGRYAIE